MNDEHRNVDRGRAKHAARDAWNRITPIAIPIITLIALFVH